MMSAWATQLAGSKKSQKSRRLRAIEKAQAPKPAPTAAPAPEAKKKRKAKG